MKKIVIYCGSRCNASCSYCHRKIDEEGASLPHSVLAFIKQQTNNEQTMVRFVGGEPTLYLPQIKEIVSASAAGTDFLISTNGLLLNNQEIINYLNSNGFFISISYDGQKGGRGYGNILVNPEYIPQIRKIDRLGFSTTLAKDNLNLSLLLEEWGEIENVIKRPMRFRPHHCHVTKPEGAPYNMTLDEIKHYTGQWQSLIGEFMRYYAEYGLANMKLLNMFYYLYDRVNGYKHSQSETRCFSKGCIQVDLKGKHHICPYIRTPETYLGEVGEDIEVLLQRQAEMIRSRRPKCLGCDLYPYCGTYCFASIRPETECEVQKRLIGWFINELGKYEDGYFDKVNMLRRY